MTAERVVFLSAYHDYRTAKRASIHPLARALAASGYDVSFVSTRFSRLSKLKADSRLFLWDRANRFEEVDGVRCYLWRTAFHPFATGLKAVDAVMTRLYPLYAALPNAAVDRLFGQADYVIVEASVAAILLRRIRRLNATAKIIYYATDRLDTVGAHPFVRERLISDAGLIAHVSLRSAKMADDFAWAGEDKLRRIGFGIEPEDMIDLGENPYEPGVRAAVSVGSMLFDEGFFHAVPPVFPDVEFHVIGCGQRFTGPANVVVYDEMPFRRTLPYLRYAAVGIAPYRQAPGVEYLSDSSLKLAQYEYLGLPAACPDFAVGEIASRSGYHVGDVASMRAAFARALNAAGTVAPRSFPTWRDIGQHLLHPDAHPETRITSR